MAWVATAPRPAMAQGTMAPTENRHVWTATPSRPLAGSRATMEYVMDRGWTRLSGSRKGVDHDDDDVQGGAHHGAGVEDLVVAEDAGDGVGLAQRVDDGPAGVGGAPGQQQSE